MATAKTKEAKIKTQKVEVSTIPGVMEDKYVLTIGDEDVDIKVVKTTGKRIAGNNGLLGEITGQYAADNILVKSNVKCWRIDIGDIVIIKGDITSRKIHCYGGKLSTKKLLDVIGNYEAVRAYYTFCNSGCTFNSNICLEEKILEWMEEYSKEAKISIAYVISAIVAHDKAMAKYAKKFIKTLRKEGTKVADLAEGIEEVTEELADLTALTEEEEED